MPAVNEHVVYRSFAGDTWDAVVTNVWAGGGRVDIAVEIPDSKEPLGTFVLTAIRWYDDPKEPLPGARPKGT
jgi:hypothetical protein